MGLFDWTRRRKEKEALDREMQQLAWSTIQKASAKPARREPFYEKKTAPERPLSTEEKSLRAWRPSGEPRRWVEAHGAHWNHDDWLLLVDHLQKSEWWPVRTDDVGRVLEFEKRAPGLVDELLAGLKGRGFDEHWFSTAERLADIGHPKAAVALIDDLGSIDAEVHKAIEYVVTNIGDERAVPPLLKRISPGMSEAFRVERMLTAILKRCLHEVRREDLVAIGMLPYLVINNDTGSDVSFGNIRELASEELSRRGV